MIISEEHRKKISEALKGRKRIPFTEEHKRKIGESQRLKWLTRDRTFSEEHKKKISEGNKGKRLGIKLSEETKKKMSIVRIGKKASEETKKKISKSLTGKKHSEETKKKMSVSQQLRWSEQRLAGMGVTVNRKIF